MTRPSQLAFRDFDVWEMPSTRRPGSALVSLISLKLGISAQKLFFHPPPEMFPHYSARMLLAGSDTVGLTLQGLMGKGVTRQNTVVFQLLIWSTSCQTCLKRCCCHIRANKNPGELALPIGMIQRSQSDEQQPGRNLQLYLHFQMHLSLTCSVPIKLQLGGTRLSNNQK